jgi:hypothetical protein
VTLTAPSTPTADQIVAWVNQRRSDQGLVVNQMRNVRDAYNSDIVIPLPELDRSEDPAIPNLIAQGLDQMAMSIASVPPDVFYPPVRPNITRSMELARTRRKANLGWWQANKLPHPSCAAAPATSSATASPPSCCAPTRSAASPAGRYAIR